MRNLYNLCAITLASLSVLVVGCGGGGTPFYGASGKPYFAITTNAHEGSSTSYESWPKVTITGYADANSLANFCDASTDKYCIADIGNASPYAITQNGISAFKTNGSGQADFGTDAIGAEWYFYATDNDSTQCNGGTASLTTITGESTGAYVTLTCGSNAADMIATPSSCVDNEQTGVNTCPSTITLSFPPPVSSTNSLPVATALSATTYDSSGTNLAQASVTAASTSSVVVPTPYTTGTTYVAVQNASGNLIGVSEFTRTVIIHGCITPVTSLSTSLSTVTPEYNKCP
jgi:hypothetical protein